MWYCIYPTTKVQQQQSLQHWCFLAQNQSVNADCCGTGLGPAGPRRLLGLSHTSHSSLPMWNQMRGLILVFFFRLSQQIPGT